MTSCRPCEFTVKFWGVRGNIPTPGIETIRYGGNTACVELQVAGQRLIFDGGTGLRVLGKQLVQEMPVQAHLFFTHTHWDRIQGFPFFAPAFVSGNQFDIYGAVGQNGASIKQRLSEQMLRPNFPVPLQMMQAALNFHDILPGSAITLEKDIVVETIALHRSNSAIGYRVTWNNHSVVYATDVEYRANQIEPRLLYLAQQADLLIYDIASAANSMEQNASPEQSPAISPSAWQAGIEVANMTQVKQMVLFHHDPCDEDDFLDQVEAEMQARSAEVRLAREGMVVSIGTH
ncbi:MAG: MBL fold metallo-hydrolase [Cyanobacteria bacterium RM1_2_2]|nr:MBL fold metallo-hydrolase [Cyanobacteria bacterium RM1_2_2]